MCHFMKKFSFFLACVELYFCTFGNNNPSIEYVLVIYIVLFNIVVASHTSYTLQSDFTNILHVYMKTKRVTKSHAYIMTT